jgi:hypothetical protein
VVFLMSEAPTERKGRPVSGFCSTQHLLLLLPVVSLQGTRILVLVLGTCALSNLVMKCEVLVLDVLHSLRGGGRFPTYLGLLHLSPTNPIPHRINSDSLLSLSRAEHPSPFPAHPMHQSQSQISITQVSSRSSVCSAW